MYSFSENGTTMPSTSTSKLEQVSIQHRLDVRHTLPRPPFGPAPSHLLSPYTHPSASVAYEYQHLQPLHQKLPQLTSSFSTIISVGTCGAPLVEPCVTSVSLDASLSLLSRLKSPLDLLGLAPIV